MIAIAQIVLVLTLALVHVVVLLAATIHEGQARGPYP